MTVVKATKTTETVTAKNNTTKAETKPAETKTAEKVTNVKETTQANGKKETETKAAAPAKKSAAKNTAPRKSAKGTKRGPKPASERTVDMFVQYMGRDISYNDIVNQIKEMWKAEGKRETSMKTLNIYVKPEDFKAYYVINGGTKGEVKGEIDF